MNENFNERLALLLQKKNMTQKDLAVKAGVTEAAISHYIKGDRTPRVSVLTRMAEALDTTSDYLLNGTETGADSEIRYAKRLIARNVHQMTREEKMDIIDILMPKE